MQKAKTTSLWRNRNFLALWSGQAISTTGSQLTQFALPVLILTITHSPIQAGIAGMVHSLPYLLLSLPAGAWLDRWDRKRAMLLCDLGRAFCLASLPLALLFGQLSILQIYLVSLLEGSLFVVFSIAEASSLKHVVPSQQLTAAASQNEATTNIAYLLGPLLGGILFGLGRFLPFLLDALSYLISVIFLASIQQNFQEYHQRKPEKLRVQIETGLSWLLHHPTLRFLALLCCTGNLLDFGTTLLVTTLALKMQASSWQLGFILAIAGLGGIGGALLASPIEKKWSFARIMVGIQWIWALALPLYLLAPNPIWLGIITIPSFVVGSIFTVIQYSYRIAAIPDPLLSRVNSVFRLIAFSGQVLGPLLVGISLQYLGAISTILLLAGLQLILALLTTTNRSSKEISIS